jgi:hypothetical protein
VEGCPCFSIGGAREDEENGSRDKMKSYSFRWRPTDTGLGIWKGGASFSYVAIL